MKILAIETSCDETAAAVVRDGREVLSNVIAAQTEFHQKYGGIVPEVAARKHIEVITPVIQEAMDKAGVGFKDIDAVAVTHGPGLVGSLIVGLCAAKAIAFALNKPLIGVNHLEAHLYASWLTSPPDFPYITLLVSGGHTMIVLVEGHGKYKLIGQTRDDAAGEAYDKVARLLGLGYPGGPLIDKLAKEGASKAINFTRPMLNVGYDFSFSGIKTAVVNLVDRESSFVDRSTNHDSRVADIAASFQQAVVDVLVTKTVRAAKEYGCQTIAVGGGVAANSLLRRQMTEQAENIQVLLPPLSLCTDNAAMVACAGYYKYDHNSEFVIRNSSLDLQAVASLKLV